MKKLFLIPVIISVILLSGCSKDEPEYVPLISTINVTNELNNKYTLTFSYDSLSRLADFTYESDKFYINGTETYPNGRPKGQEIYSLDKTGKVTQYYLALRNGLTYQAAYEYDSKNRISIVKAESGGINQNGDPDAGKNVIFNAKIEWDKNNNVKKINYNSDNDFTEESIFTEYTTIKSTISLKNLGLNFFGAYQAFDRSGYLAPVKSYVFAIGSAYLPKKTESKVYFNGDIRYITIETFTYKIDEKNRVNELEVYTKRLNADGNVSFELTEKFEYTYKN